MGTLLTETDYSIKRCKSLYILQISVFHLFKAPKKSRRSERAVGDGVLPGEAGLALLPRVGHRAAHRAHEVPVGTPAVLAVVSWRLELDLLRARIGAEEALGDRLALGSEDVPLRLRLGAGLELLVES